jgi:hypothetical protein
MYHLENGDVLHSKRCCRVPKRRNRYLIRKIRKKDKVKDVVRTSFPLELLEFDS